MPLEGADLLARGHDPQPYRLVSARRGQGFAVRREGHGRHTAFVPIEGTGFFAVGDIPEPYRGVIAPRGYGLAVRGESHATDRILMPPAHRPHARKGTGRQRIAVEVG